MATADNPWFTQLEQDINGIDVCVIGAGISGLSTAYMLTMEGKSVVVLEDGAVASGESEGTTAHITNVLDSRYFEIQRMHGKANARLAAESLRTAIDRIESIAAAEQIDCDFQRVPGYLFLGEGSKQNVLNKELKSVTECGFTGVDLIDELPLGLKVPALRFQRQAQFHILKYLQGLCRSITRCGGRIFCFEHVENIQDGAWVKLKTSSGRTITARNVVAATNSPVSDWWKIHTKQAAYRTYVIGAAVPAGVGKRLMPSSVHSVDEIQPGEGAVLWQNGAQIAVSKDKDGGTHKLSATCKHMGATVCWNSCEKSWDCPAHGSRYDADGKVIDGPANSNLDQQGEQRHKGAA